jgi:hypothetical protein
MSCTRARRERNQATADASVWSAGTNLVDAEETVGAVVEDAGSLPRLPPDSAGSDVLLPALQERGVKVRCTCHSASFLWRKPTSWKRPTHDVLWSLVLNLLLDTRGLRI